jgi:hypothetical protein
MHLCRRPDLLGLLHDENETNKRRVKKKRNKTPKNTLDDGVDDEERLRVCCSNGLNRLVYLPISRRHCHKRRSRPLGPMTGHRRVRDGTDGRFVIIGLRVA